MTRLYQLDTRRTLPVIPWTRRTYSALTGSFAFSCLEYCIVSDHRALHLLLLWPPSRLSAPRNSQGVVDVALVLSRWSCEFACLFRPLRKAARNNHKPLNSTNAALPWRPMEMQTCFHFCISAFSWRGSLREACVKIASAYQCDADFASTRYCAKCPS